MNILNLRKRIGLTQQELAQKIGCNQHSVSSWENGTREPNIQTLCALADIFDVSLDKLVGREIAKNNERILQDMKVFGNDEIFNIKKLRKRHNITQIELANELNVTQTTVSKWEKDSKKLSLEQAIKIAQYFNLPSISFVARKPENLSCIKKELIEKIKTLSEKEGHLLYKFLEIIQIFQTPTREFKPIVSSNVIIDLKRFRLKSKLSQTDIAKKLGITQQTYANYENGTTQAPYKFLISFANIFNTSIDEIIHI